MLKIVQKKQYQTPPGIALLGNQLAMYRKNPKFLFLPHCFSKCHLQFISPQGVHKGSSFPFSSSVTGISQLSFSHSGIKYMLTY